MHERLTCSDWQVLKVGRSFDRRLKRRIDESDNRNNTGRFRAKPGWKRDLLLEDVMRLWSNASCLVTSKHVRQESPFVACQHRSIAVEKTQRSRLHESLGCLQSSMQRLVVPLEQRVPYELGVHAEAETLVQTTRRASSARSVIDLTSIPQRTSKRRLRTDDTIRGPRSKRCENSPMT